MATIKGTLWICELSDLTARDHESTRLCNATDHNNTLFDWAKRRRIEACSSYFAAHNARQEVIGCKPTFILHYWV